MSTCGAPEVMLVGVLVSLAGSPAQAQHGDFDGNGYVGLDDYRYFNICLSISGPTRAPVFGECLTNLDVDQDGDVDLADFADTQRARGHLPIRLRDGRGDVLAIDSTRPYSGRQTCGTAGCHDLDDPAGITNGLKFQQGRTNSAGDVVMKDDALDDGRWWMRSPGRFGIWSQATTLQMAGKENADESCFDQSAFAWIRDCGGCHVGGGPSEFDRDGELLYDEVTGEFGYESLGKTAEDVRLDGDYADLDFTTGEVSPAPWDVTGVADPDCLFCHRKNRPIVEGLDMIRFRREAALGAGPDMVDAAGQPVPAFAAAATAGQGWVSQIDIIQDGFVPRALTMQIDYSVGVTDGVLVTQPDQTLTLAPHLLARPPRDEACWACHNQKALLNGMVWFDGTPDVHYRKLNKLSDEDPTNDIAGADSTACAFCHPGGLDHNFAKGNDLLFHSRNDLDWVGMRSCRDCHLESSAVRHPDAPAVPGDVLVHLVGDPETGRGPFEIMSCQACHVPYALGPALAYFDASAGGTVWPTMCCAGMTFQYYSADPLDPTDPDKSRWYPTLMWKEDSDGVSRLFPAIAMPNIHWADWEQNGTPEDLSDDTLTPIIQWRMYQVIDADDLATVTDDNGDTLPEMNRPAEMLTFMHALQRNDTHGKQVAARPVLVKGPLVWYEDPGSPIGVSTFAHEGTGISVDWYFYVWGQDHNVLPKEESWGYSAANPTEGCRDCHRPDTFDSPVVDRLIMVDPYGVDGMPVYDTVRNMVGINPP